jgi:DNA-directed RNA polymerase specialized sigma24 family protein
MQAVRDLQYAIEQALRRLLKIAPQPATQADVTLLRDYVGRCYLGKLPGLGYTEHDFLSECLAKALNYLNDPTHPLRNEEGPKSWFDGIARRHVADIIRRRKRQIRLRQYGIDPYLPPRLTCDEQDDLRSIVPRWLGGEREAPEEDYTADLGPFREYLRSVDPKVLEFLDTLLANLSLTCCAERKQRIRSHLGLSNYHYTRLHGRLLQLGCRFWCDRGSLEPVDED